MLTAKRLLGHRPSRHPVGETSVAIVGHGGLAAPSCCRAPLAMDPATPGLLPHRPRYHPIGKTICTIIGISWPCRFYRHHDRRWQHNRRCCRCATDMVVCAAPTPLLCRPAGDGANRTIVGIHGPNGSGRRWRLRDWRLRDWLCERRLRHEGRWWRCGCWGLRKGGRGHGGAASTCGHTTVILLLGRPHTLPIQKAIVAIEGQ